MKKRVKFDGNSQAINVVGTTEVGMIHINIYWLDIDNYGKPRERLQYSTHYMTPKKARDLSDILRKTADEMEAK